MFVTAGSNNFNKYTSQLMQQLYLYRVDIHVLVHDDAQFNTTLS